MDDTQEFLDWFRTSLHDAEVALHNGDAGPRHALWSRTEPVTVYGAWRTAIGRREVDELFDFLARGFSDAVSFDVELQAVDVIGDAAYTVALEHSTVSVDHERRSYTLRVTQVYRREGGEWRVAHRHGDTFEG